MSLFFDQIVNGLVLGNIYALLAAGLALIFGVAHLVNFAHGSVYMGGAYAAWLFIAKLGWPVWAAIPAAAAVGAVLGLLLERFAVRPFQKSAHIAPLLATIGAGMILDSLAEILFSPNPQSFPDVVSHERINVGNVSLGVLDGVIFLVALSAALGLFLLLKFTRLGRSLRAAAQDFEAAEQMGVRVRRVNAAAFAIASALGALGGALIGLYYNQILPTMGLQAGLKGFIACILGGLGSIPASMGGGLILGISESLGVSVFGSSSRDLVAYSLLILALFLRPNGIFGRREGSVREILTGSFIAQKGSVRIGWPFALVLVAIAVTFPLVVHDGYILQILTNSWIAAIFALSLTLLSGTVGIMSLGHSGFMAVGAYASALLSLRLDFPFPLALLFAGASAAVIGTLLALPALRLKGHYITIATLAIGEIIRQVILNWDGLTQGALGLAGIPAPRILGKDFVSTQDFYYLSLAVLLVAGAALALILRSPLGRTLRSIREDESAAMALGVQVSRYKAIALAVSAFIAGIAGSLTAHLYTYIDHNTFNFTASIQVLIMVILGGLGNLWGAVLGALVISILPELFRFAAEYRGLLIGLVFLVVLRFRPQGVLGSR